MTSSRGGARDRLPTLPATYTPDADLYVSEWRAISEKLIRLLPQGYDLFSFDPGFVMRHPNGERIEFPLAVALHLTRNMV